MTLSPNCGGRLLTISIIPTPLMYFAVGKGIVPPFLEGCHVSSQSRQNGL
jgi:hypothetical protein